MYNKFNFGYDDIAGPAPLIVMRVLKVAVYFVVHISVHLVARDSM